MRVQLLGLLLAVTLWTGCRRQSPQSGLEPAADPKVVSIVVFNQRGSRVPFALLVGDSIVLDTVASLATFHPSIVMSSGLRLERGNYRVIVLDRARGTIYEANLQLRGLQATIEVWFDRGVSSVGVAYGKRIYM
jgi:hypothetical protein